MNEINLFRQRAVAAALSVILVSVAIWFAYHVFWRADDYNSFIPPVSQINWMLSGAGLVLLIGGTDLPAAIRRSQLLRVQLQCWGVWMVLVAVLLMSRASSIEALARITFSIAACVLAVYSLVANWKPRDLF